jgi:hypothetical protein
LSVENESVPDKSIDEINFSNKNDTSDLTIDKKGPRKFNKPIAIKTNKGKINTNEFQEQERMKNAASSNAPESS